MEFRGLHIIAYVRGEKSISSEILVLQRGEAELQNFNRTNNEKTLDAKSRLTHNEKLTPLLH